MLDLVDYSVLIKGVSPFREMTDDELETLSKWVLVRPYKRDATLFVEGLPGEDLYIVIDGGVNITKKANGSDVQLASIGPGEIVGEMSLIDSRPRSATGKTNADSTLAIITKKYFGEMLKSDPKIASKILMALVKIVSGRLR